jgi:tetratricopeptide (TPR) repeat protein/O-antigen ligase
MNAINAKNTINFYDNLIDIGLISLIIFTPLAFGSTALWAVMIIESIALMLLAIWILKMLANSEISYIKTPLNIFIILFLLFIIFQLLPLPLSFIRLISPNTDNLYKFTLANFPESLNHGMSLSIYRYATVMETVKWLSFVLIFLVVLNNLRGKKRINRIINVMIVTGFLVACFGVIQKFTWNGKIFWVKELARGGSPFGPYINYNHFAGYMEMLIPLSLGMLFTDIRREKKILFGFMALIMISALFISLSRGGILGFLGSIFFMSFMLTIMKTTKKALWVSGIILLAIIIALLWLNLHPTLDKFLAMGRIEDLKADVRISTWQGTWQMIRDFPIIGIGFGAFQYLFPKYQMAETKLLFQYTHNDYLQLWSEMGLIGLLITLGFFIFYFRWIFKTLFKRHDPYVKGIAVGGLTSIVAILIHSFTDFNLHIPANIFHFVLILSLVFIVINSQFRQNEEKILLSARTFSVPKKARLFFLVSIPLFIIAILNFIIRSYVIEGYAQPDRLYTFSANQLEKITKLNSDNAEFYYRLGNIYANWANNAVARHLYEKAVLLNPADAKYHQRLGWTYGNLDKQTEALKEFEIAVSYRPTNAYYHRLYAVYCFNQAKSLGSPQRDILIKEAVSQYRQAIELEPFFVSEAIEQYAQFNPDYDTLKTIIPTAEGHYRFSKYLNKKGQKSESANELETAISLWNQELKTSSDIKSADIHSKLGKIYLDLEDYDKAQEEYKKALEFNPGDPWIYFQLAIIHQEKGQIDEAIDLYKKAIAVKPDHIWSYCHLALIYDSRGERERALQMWKKVLEVPYGDKEAKDIAKRAMQTYQ